ncbi:hypothetical protein HCB37_16940 [Listeria booriae]|uniref:hypothetical protein n=1 Tax=Listeria booriae TaxID=1552123 RepID=UPI001628B414|nr:hypothetical protein [Listeria booriae]MBC2020660.1 hypothetical protein [Listeria booriae]MBC2266190.1 hypothetical protein [Listeria booriae]
MLENNILTLENKEDIEVIYEEGLSDDDLKKSINRSKSISLLIEMGIIDRERLNDVFSESDIEEIIFSRSKMLLIKNILLDNVIIDEVVFIYRLLSNSNNQVYILSDDSVHLSVCKSEFGSNFFKKKKKVDEIKLRLEANQMVIMSDYDGSAVIILRRKRK